MDLSKCSLDREYISSCKGMIKLILLATGGGVFGIISHNNLHYYGGDSAEALLWVSVFAWGTTLIFYVFSIFGKTLLNCCGNFAYSLTITLMYILTTVIWGVYNTFPLQLNPKGLVVFILALITTIGYLEQSVCALMESRKECGKPAAPAEDAVIENGKAEEMEIDEQKSGDP